MKNDKLPRLFEEGLKHIAGMGVQHVYEEIIEEYGEKLKQDFISQMTKKLEAYVTVFSVPYSEESGFKIKIEVDFKGVELP